MDIISGILMGHYKNITLKSILTGSELLKETSVKDYVQPVCLNEIKNASCIINK